MPLPYNFLSEDEEQKVIQQLTLSSNNKPATVPCRDARFARLKNGTICPIPDMDGNISERNRDVILYSRNGASVERKPMLKNVIAIILESPHVCEFKNSVNVPAMGSSGRLFFAHFDSLFSSSSLCKQISLNKNYDMVFVNSIQYQTSCGAYPLSDKTNKKRRDSNWISIFNSCGANDLCDRLRALNPVLVLNLCTKSLNDLNSKVDAVVRPIYHGQYTTGWHPTNWYKTEAKIY